MEFVFHLVFKFVMYVYSGSRSNTAFLLAAICEYLNCVFLSFVLLANSESAECGQSFSCAS